VAPPGNQAANREHKLKPKLEKPSPTRPKSLRNHLPCFATSAFAGTLIVNIKLFAWLTEVTGKISVVRQIPIDHFKRVFMRTLALLSILLLVSGCGGDQVSDSSEPVEQSAKSTAASSDIVTSGSSAVAETPPGVKAKLPFDMPIMPGARYLSDVKFSKPTKRRGPEAIATIIAKGTTLEVVAFYEKAMTENGFTPTLGKQNDASTASVMGVRKNGETFSITSMRGGSKAKEGERQTAIVATKPKSEENE